MPEPFNPDNAREAEAPVLLAMGAEFTGLLALAGPARIEGLLRGEVVGPGPLWIGPRANVEARIETDEITIWGTLAGEVWVSRRVVLGPAARVRGELHTPSLLLVEGAILEGRCAAGSGPIRDSEPLESNPDASVPSS